jgi:hypothetical protein
VRSAGEMEKAELILVVSPICHQPMDLDHDPIDQSRPPFGVKNIGQSDGHPEAVLFYTHQRSGSEDDLVD